MKKRKLLCVIMIMLFLLTGCSSKTVRCIKEENNTKTTIKLKFDNNNIIESMSQYQIKKYDRYDAHIELDYYDLKEKYQKLDNIKGIKYDLKENKFDITINLDIDYKKLENDDSSLILVELYSDKDYTVNRLVNDNFTCR